MQWDGYREKGLMVTTEVRAQVQLHEVPRAWMRFYCDYAQRQLRETARQRTKASG